MSFKIALRLKVRHVFKLQTMEILNALDTLTLTEKYFLKNLSRKMGYCVLVESRKIKYATFSYKTVL